MTSMKCGYVFFMELGILCSALLLKASCSLQVLWNLALSLFIVLSCGKANKRISLFHILKIKIETKSHDFGNYPLTPFSMYGLFCILKMKHWWESLSSEVFLEMLQMHCMFEEICFFCWVFCLSWLAISVIWCAVVQLQAS